MPRSIENHIFLGIRCIFYPTELLKASKSHALPDSDAFHPPPSYNKHRKDTLSLFSMLFIPSDLGISIEGTHSPCFRCLSGSTRPKKASKGHTFLVFDAFPAPPDRKKHRKHPLSLFPMPFIPLQATISIERPYFPCFRCLYHPTPE